MEHFFNLPVTYKGKELTYQARLVTFGYSFKFFVMVDSVELVFEKDDAGEYRVVQENTVAQFDHELLQAIVNSLEQIQNA